MSELKVLLLLIYPIILVSCNCRAANKDNSTVLKSASCVQECKSVQERDKNRKRSNNNDELDLDLELFIQQPLVTSIGYPSIKFPREHPPYFLFHQTSFLLANPDRGPPQNS